MSSLVSHQRSPTGESSSSTRCTHCNTKPKESGRNLVVCIDGTSNEFGRNNTNVVKLFAMIDLETSNREQFAYYTSGIGTRPTSLNLGRALSDKFDMAIAWNMEEIVKDAYGWLARMYQEGDQIYLFGFSRGAYQVRVLAGMIHKVGLIRTPTEKQIGTAYGHYDAIRSGKAKTKQIAREFKNTFSWKDQRVHFVGVWDTVSSVGLIRGDVFLSTSASASHACHFRHALALDELRVKFMPEYFHEMNSRTDDGCEKSKYITNTSQSEDGSTTEALSKWRQSTGTDGSANTCQPIGKKNWTADVKEVWFAGCHSDVGGTNRPGKSYQAGNVSLLWMRREAAAKGLLLHPTDIVWIPDDLDFGTSDSMSFIWRIVEYMPIKHQVSFSGSNDDERRWHRLQPRRIIPGQRVHASVLFANAYKPKGWLGEGFDIPMIQADPETELDNHIWETEMFEESAAQVLVEKLGAEQGVAPIHLDRLLFMLRFKEGKKSVRNVEHWEKKFATLIQRPDCAPLVRLVAIVAYYEASCDPDIAKSAARPRADLKNDILDQAKNDFFDILKEKNHPDGPRVVALLRPLSRHEDLRKHVLTSEVLKYLVELLDVIIAQTEENFARAMDGLNCLLQCEETRKEIIVELSKDYPDSRRSKLLRKVRVSRLSRILEVNDPPLLTAALRMIMSLARDQEGKNICSVVKPRLRRLACMHERLVGPLAVEVLLALYTQDSFKLSILRSIHFRANLASALVRLNVGRGDSAEEQGQDNGHETMKRLFGYNTDESQLSLQQSKLIKRLKSVVNNGNTRERIAATLTLLKLCDSNATRAFLCEIKLMDVFINQLRREDSAILAAYALAACLKHPDMKESVKDNEFLPNNIVHMLRYNHFDDAVGQAEGFQIFGELIEHDELRKEMIEKYDITKVLKTKLEKGNPKETRTSLICLEILRSFEHGDIWTSKLVDKSLERLRKMDWDDQKAGVTVLSALAQTKHGEEAIGKNIRKIIQLLLPDNYLPIRANEGRSSSSNPVSSRTGQVRQAADSGAGKSTWRGANQKTSSWMLGPACALRILARNGELRKLMHRTAEYNNLKHLYLSGMLVDENDTSAFRIWTPNRADVVDMLGKMVKVVDGELSEEGLLSIGDTVLPHIHHWNRLTTLLRDSTVAGLTVFTVLLGVLSLAAPAAIVSAPIYYVGQGCGYLKRKVERHLDTRVLDSPLRVPDDADTSVPEQPEGEAGGVHEGEAGPSTVRSLSEGSSSGAHDGEGSRGVMVVTQSSTQAGGARDVIGAEITTDTSSM